MTLDEIFTRGQEFAQIAFAEQGEVLPMWICETEMGDFVPICVHMPENKHKDETAAELKQTLKKNKVVRYVSLMESWLHDSKDGTRSEGVLVAAEDKDGNERSGIFMIERPKNGKPRLLPFEKYDLGGIGRFTNLLATQH